MSSTTDPNPRPQHGSNPGGHDPDGQAQDGQAQDGHAAEGGHDVPLDNPESPIPASISLMVADHYGALRALAERQVTAERARTGQQTISPTSLLGETFRRLVQQETQIANPDHLAAIATMLFVRIIADRRRRRLTIKRGKGAKQLPLGEAVAQSDARTPARSTAPTQAGTIRMGRLRTGKLRMATPRRVVTTYRSITLNLRFPQVSH